MRIHQLTEAPIAATDNPNDPMIYGHEKANSMTLQGRIQQARAQLKELAELAESNDLVVWERITQLHKGGVFMGLEQNLEQIRHGIEELAQRRRKGGVNARGIDKNIGEANGPAQQAAIAIAMKKAGKKPKNEGMDDTVYPNAEVIKSKNGKSVGEIYQDENGWGCLHYGADYGADFMDSREEALQSLKDVAVEYRQDQEEERQRIANRRKQGVAEAASNAIDKNIG